MTETENLIEDVDLNEENYEPSLEDFRAEWWNYIIDRNEDYE